MMSCSMSMLLLFRYPAINASSNYYKILALIIQMIVNYIILRFNIFCWSKVGSFYWLNFFTEIAFGLFYCSTHNFIVYLFLLFQYQPFFKLNSCIRIKTLPECLISYCVNFCFAHTAKYVRGLYLFRGCVPTDKSKYKGYCGYE